MVLGKVVEDVKGGKEREVQLERVNTSVPVESSRLILLLLDRAERSSRSGSVLVILSYRSESSCSPNEV